ncbi:MAG TPA: hypothetical protein DCE42_27120 [Myxococcales bacterium]|nr:hypothetical protein [Deltaproteobacteria bacterium]HAA58464.1 hypothetical protein [Myxococcales bacterium]
MNEYTIKASHVKNAKARKNKILLRLRLLQRQASPSNTPTTPSSPHTQPQPPTKNETLCLHKQRQN